jgi:hypothetical protein
VGFAQEKAALAVKLEHIPKHVLQVLAFRACGTCGHARPGVAQIALDTGLGERSVRDALVELRQRPELLKVYRYPKGGRAVTTEYIVMPELAKVIPTDCGDWDRHNNTLRRVQGIRRRKALNPAPEGAETLRGTAYHPSVHPHPSGDEPASGLAAAGPDGPDVEPHHTTGPHLEPDLPTPPSLPSEAAPYVQAVLTRLQRQRGRTAQR